MKNLYTLLALGLMTLSHTSVATLQFENIAAHTLTSFIKKHIKTSKWFAYQVPAAPNTTSMCCWQRGEKSTCDLNNLTGGYGSSDQDKLTKNIRVFVHLESGKVNQILPVGDSCPVTAQGKTISWLEQVNNQDSIDWLTQQAITSGDDNGSLYTLSTHQGQSATTALAQVAKSTSKHAESAVFWLGQRHHDGLPLLKNLLSQLPQSTLRKSINFAISQNQHLKAVDLLYDVAQNDASIAQRSDAIFWLSQVQDKSEVVPFLMSTLNKSDNRTLSDQVIFSLSQLNTEPARQALFQILTGEFNRADKKQALFWLSQSENPLVLEQLDALL